MTYLVVGIILIVLLVGVSALQWALRRRQAAHERALPHVAELAALALAPAEFPGGYHVDYRGPLTNERLAYQSPDERATLDELDELGRVIGYRQAFRDPRSYGEVIDVALNFSLRARTQQRLLTVDLSLFEDPEGAADSAGAAAPSDDGASIRVSDVDGHGLGFAGSVRQWSRMAGATEVQRKTEVRWSSGRLSCVVSGDSEPPGGVEAQAVCDLAARVQERVAASGLAAEAAAS